MSQFARIVLYNNNLYKYFSLETAFVSTPLFQSAKFYHQNKQLQNKSIGECVTLVQKYSSEVKPYPIEYHELAFGTCLVITRLRVRVLVALL